jgi:formylglycine-generating enzyme required for sulfatase activity
MTPGANAPVQDPELPAAFGSREEVPDRIIHLPNSSGGLVAMAFRPIPACPGGFLMGSSRGYREDESPRHRVVIPQPCYLGTFPVTQRQFACFRPEHENGFAGKPDHPAEQIDWHEARAFLTWLAKEARNLPKGLVPRLPCEAEWEYACRAGTDTEYSSGDGEVALELDGWHGGHSGMTTHSVGKKRENPWGLHDMHGNVWEWCEDVYDSQAYSKRGHLWLAKAWTEEMSDEKGEPQRVVRGGSWILDPEWCRAASRLRWLPGVGVGNRGFRVFLGLPGPAAGGHPTGKSPPTADRDSQQGFAKASGGAPHPQTPLSP